MTPTTPSPISDQAAGEPVAWPYEITRDHIECLIMDHQRDGKKHLAGRLSSSGSYLIRVAESFRWCLEQIDAVNSTAQTTASPDQAAGEPKSIIGDSHDQEPNRSAKNCGSKGVHCMCPACKNGVIHASDCSVHNMPAYPDGPCDCGADIAARATAPSNARDAEHEGWLTINHDETTIWLTEAEARGEMTRGGRVVRLAARATAEQSRDSVIEECCAAIKVEDDRMADEDYMLDSNDCINVCRALKSQQDAAIESKPAESSDSDDAKRYRWLRDVSEPGICAFYLSVGKAFDGVKFKRETVDQAIDAQIDAAIESQRSGNV